jgi:hypothetical protein
MITDLVDYWTYTLHKPLIDHPHMHLNCFF